MKRIIIVGFRTVILTSSSKALRIDWKPGADYATVTATSGTVKVEILGEQTFEVGSLGWTHYLPTGTQYSTEK